MLKVVQEDDASSGNGSQSHIYLPKSNFMSIVSSPQYQGIQSPHHGRKNSRERNMKMVNQQNQQQRNIGVVGQKEPLKLVNVYSNVQQKRQAARQMLNKKSSEEKLYNPNNQQFMYNNRKPIEQRYKSHLRGQDAPQGLIRNQSKPTLQLPEIHNSSLVKQGGDIMSRNDLQHQHMASQRSKKNLSLVHGQNSIGTLPHAGGYNMQGMNSPQDGKIKNYYKNDLTKIYMVGGQAASPQQQRQMQNEMMMNNNQNSQQQIQYNNRQGTLNNSPSLEHLNGVSGTGIQGGNHFNQRHQSQDVGAKSNIKNKIQARKRPVMQGEYDPQFDQNSMEDSIGAAQQQYLQQIQVGNQNHMSNSPGSGGRFRSGDNRS